MKTKKLLGFTLIELLIVIAIIGILAVAFLPSIMGAPAKGRDAARIADLQKLQKVLVNENLGGTAYPATACVDGTSFSTYLTALGGVAPKDPGDVASLAVKGGPTTACDDKYTYIKDPQTSAGKSAGYSFGLYTRMETSKASNAKCNTGTGLGFDATVLTAPVSSDASSEYCYAVLTQ